MKILYGTGNQAKLNAMRDNLKNLGIEIIGLRDMDGDIPDVPENGNTPEENARQKAQAYFRYYKMPVFSCDTGLVIEGLPDELQPGVHVRNVKGKHLTDDEMIAYYGGLAEKYGDLTARYINAICLVMDESHIYESMDESLWGEKFLITSKPYSQVRRKGFPLDSLSKEIKSGKYYYELEEKKEDALVEYNGFANLFIKWGLTDQN